MENTSILIVGAGPVGLVLACELARRNVQIRIIDKLPAPTTESRAIVVHARSLEMLNRIGVVEEIIESGIKTVGMDMHASGKTLAHFKLDTVDSPFPFSITTAQTETERILTERLATLGVKIERGVELQKFDQDSSGVHFSVLHADGRTETGTATYLVGTDGASSTVRHQMGEKLEGSFKGEKFLMGDVEADYDLPHESMHSYFSPGDGPLLIFPMVGNRIRAIAEITNEKDNPDATLERLQAVVDNRAGGIKLLSARWLTIFEIHHAQAPRYRSGRVFIAGDAAHVHSPAAAQGMNTGMQDAFNLGWKLAAAVDAAVDVAVNSGPNEVLLDSYQLERHPIAKAVIASTTKITELGTVDRHWEQQVRNHAIEFISRLAPVQHLLATQTEETAVTYRDSTIVAGRGRRQGLHPGDCAPAVDGTDLQQQLVSSTGHVALVFPGSKSAAPAIDGVRTLVVDASIDPDGRIARRYGREKGGLVLVRPDGYIGYIGELDDRDGPEAYLRLVR